jgi:hypothetical protein
LLTTTRADRAGLAFAAASPKARARAVFKPHGPELMDIHARLIALAAPIALTAAVVLIGIWLSPTIAAALSHAYPVGATIFALRSTLSTLLHALARGHRG